MTLNAPYGHQEITKKIKINETDKLATVFLRSKISLIKVSSLDVFKTYELCLMQVLKIGNFLCLYLECYFAVYKVH